MTPFVKATHEPVSEERVEAMARGILALDPNLRLSKAMKHVRRELQDIVDTDTVYVNDRYQVNVREAEVSDGWPAMVHLSIKRRDKEPIHDWRDLQTIKNMIVGPEHEAVELYPRESRVVDTVNQYHLWVVKEPGKSFPFGFDYGRAVRASAADAAATGGKQR